jgi:hypothetical protein
LPALFLKKEGGLIWWVMSVLYPVAANAETALSAPLGRAAREREALGLAAATPGREVRFVVEMVGPAFESREAALDACQGRVDDVRPGSSAVAPEDRFLTVREVLAPVKGRRPRVEPAKPVFKNGRRWPKPATELKTCWRVSISYWKVVEAPASALAPARKTRRDESARGLGRDALEALTRQPLAPIAPQRPLDIGLFEVRAPENPGLVLPDE